MFGRAHPRYQVHIALQLLARQRPRRWLHLLRLRPSRCHSGEHRGEGIEGASMCALNSEGTAGWGYGALRRWK